MADFIYLASKSPRRQQLLEQMGMRIEWLLPGDDEDAESLEALLPGEAPDATTLRLAEADPLRKVALTQAYAAAFRAGRLKVAADALPPEPIRMPAGRLLKDLAAPQSAIAVLLEPKRGRERYAGLAFGREVAQRQFLAAPFLQFGAVIPGVDLRGPSV